MKKSFWSTAGLFAFPVLLVSALPVWAQEAGTTWLPIPRSVSFLQDQPMSRGSYYDSFRGGYIGLGISVPHGARIDIAGEVLPYVNIVAHFSWFGSDFSSESVFQRIEGAQDGIPVGDVFRGGQAESVYWSSNSKLIASQWTAGLLLEIVTPVGLYARGGLMWMDNQTRWVYTKEDGDGAVLRPTYKSLIPYGRSGTTGITERLDSNLFPYLALGLRAAAGQFLFGIEAGIILTDAVRALALGDETYFDGVFETCDLNARGFIDSSQPCVPVSGRTLSTNGIPPGAVRAIQFLPSLALTIAYRF